MSIFGTLLFAFVTIHIIEFKQILKEKCKYGYVEGTCK